MQPVGIPLPATRGEGAGDAWEEIDSDELRDVYVIALGQPADGGAVQALAIDQRGVATILPLANLRFRVDLIDALQAVIASAGDELGDDDGGTGPLDIGADEGADSAPGHHPADPDAATDTAGDGEGARVD